MELSLAAHSVPRIPVFVRNVGPFIAIVFVWALAMMILSHRN
jgi:hypothetical protein